jgi:hypothetical protein
VKALKDLAVAQEYLKELIQSLKPWKELDHFLELVLEPPIELVTELQQETRFPHGCLAPSLSKVRDDPACLKFQF